MECDLKGILSPGLYVPWCQVGFEGDLKSWSMSLSVGWDLKGILSPGLCPLGLSGI